MESGDRGRGTSEVHINTAWWERARTGNQRHPQAWRLERAGFTFPSVRICIAIDEKYCPTDNRWGSICRGRLGDNGLPTFWVWK